MEPAIDLRREAGRSTWEEMFCSKHLSVISGGWAVVSQRLEAAADELRRGGEGAAFAAELLAGESSESEGELGGGIGRVRDRSRPKDTVRGSGGVFFQNMFRGCLGTPSGARVNLTRQKATYVTKEKRLRRVLIFVFRFLLAAPLPNAVSV